MTSRWRSAFRVTCSLTAFTVSILLMVNAVWTSAQSQPSLEADEGTAVEDGRCTMAFCSEFPGKIGDSVLTLSDEETENKRIFVIGDVHGCYAKLMELLTKCDVFHGGNAERVLKDDVIIIFVGDLVNKGPDSMSVLNFARTTKSVFSVKGNHELYWLKFGAAQASEEHFSYLESLPFVIRIPRHNAYIVHAGLLADLPLSDQPVDALVHMRNVLVEPAGERRPYVETDAGVHWASLWAGPEHVYFGHDARRGRDADGNPRVQRFPLATGLDTRCVKGGALTAVVLPSEHEQFYSVLCPIKYSD